MNIREDETHLWLVYDQNITEPQLLNEYHAILTEEECRQQGRFHFNKHRHQYLITRALVRSTLSLYVSTVRPTEWEFKKNRYGKPSIKNIIDLPFQFNLSHTDGMIVLAVALKREVGVDVEWLGRKCPTVDIAKRFFTTQEIQQLRALPEINQRDRFFDLWTLKEAYIKACGMGLSMPLDRFSFLFHKGKKFKILFHSRHNDQAQNWLFSKILPNKTHKVALAVCDRAGFAQDKQLSLTFIEAVPLRQTKEINLTHDLSYVK